jgi:Uma2 family endonuclease
MATVPIDEGLISVREYLRTSYSPDREYVDGRIVERNLGEKEHSLLQKYFILLFGFHEDDWGVVVYPELRTQVALTSFRIPDVLVVTAGVEFERLLETPPLIAIEILSPRDEWGDVQEKIDEYVAFGVENIWVLDPIRRRAWTADAAGLHSVESGELSVSGTPIRVSLSEAFAKSN